MKKTTSILFIGLFIHFSALGAVYVWDGGASNDRYSSIGNWDPTAPSGGPQAGDTGDVTDSFRVEVGTSSEITTGATINFQDSSSLERNNSSFANMGGTFSFSGSSMMKFTDLRLQSGATLNWDSSGTFDNGSLGLSNQPNYLMSGGITNMSNGTWTLDTSGTDSLKIEAGTFNMTGGEITSLDRMRLESTFNLGGTGELYIGDEFMTADAFLNFQGSNSALFIQGQDEGLSHRYGEGYIGVDGVAISDDSMLNFENVNVGGTDYTKVTAVPEPATTILFAGLFGLLFVLGRRGVRRR